MKLGSKKYTVVLFTLLSVFSVFSNVFFFSPAANAAMSQCAPASTGFGSSATVTATIKITPMGSYDALDVSLQDSQGHTVRSAKTCLPASSGSQTHTSTTAQATFTQVDPGDYKVCYKQSCTSLATKTTGALNFPHTLTVNAATSGVPNPNENVTVKVKIKIPAATSETTYGPFSISLEPLTSGQAKQNKDTVAQVVAQGSPAQTIEREVKFTNIKPDLIKACVVNIPGICQGIEKENGVNATIVINVPEDKSAFLIGAGTGGTSEPTCGGTIQGIGWIVCPIMNTLVRLNDAIFETVEGMLTINPLQQQGGPNTIYAAWGSMRNIANVVFVIFFLVIIYSQLTSTGITNYGIKKMLPKLIICAIAVNLSFLLMQITVDVANIVGQGLYDLIRGMAPPVTVSWATLLDEVLVAGFAAAGVTIAVGLAFGLESFLLLIAPGVIMAFLAWLAAFLTLLVRQIAIPIVAIISPLAFVAYLLPNTQSWFNKWKDLLVSMLMMYPLAAIIFGGAQFAASITINGGGPWNKFLGLVILALPMFSLPFLVRQGGPLLSKVGGAMSRMAERARNPLTNAANERRDTTRAEYLAGNSRNGWRGSMQPSNQRREANRRIRRTNASSATEEFNRQVDDNEILDRQGNAIDGRAARVRENTAKRRNAALGKSINAETTRTQPGMANEEYAAEHEERQATAGNTRRIMNDRTFDATRSATARSEGMANVATNLADRRTERSDGMLQVRALEHASAKRLEEAKDQTQTSINRAASGETVTGINAATRSTLQATAVASGTAKVQLDTSTKAVDAMIEAAPGVIQAKAANVVAGETLEAAQNRTNTIIKRAAAGEDVAGIDAATSAQLMNSAEQIEVTKTDLDTATKAVGTRVETSPGVLESRVANAVMTGNLEVAQGHTRQVIEELKSVDRPDTVLTTDAARIAASDPGLRAQLQANVIEGAVVKSGSDAAVSMQNQDIADAFTAAGAEAPGGDAYRAAGVLGEQGVARVQAKATSAQAQFRQENVNAQMALFNSQGFTAGDTLGYVEDGRQMDELLQVAMGTNPRAGRPSTPEEQEAAMQLVHSTGSYKAMETIQNQIATMPPGAPETVRMQQTLQKLYTAKRPMFVGGGEMGQLSAGIYGSKAITPAEAAIGISTPFEKSVFDFLKAGKFSAEKLAMANKDEVSRMADVLNPAVIAELNVPDPSNPTAPTAATALGTRIEEALSNPDINKDITPQQRAQLNRVLSSLGRPPILS